MLVGHKTVARNEEVVLVRTRSKGRPGEEEGGEEEKQKQQQQQQQHPVFLCPVFAALSRSAGSRVGSVALRTGLTQAMLHKMAIALVIKS